jgi:hypothetical protein
MSGWWLHRSVPLPLPGPCECHCELRGLQGEFVGDRCNYYVYGVFCVQLFKDKGYHLYSVYSYLGESGDLQEVQ